MKNEQFEKFLKANKLDVESVTFPMTEIPMVAETWRSRDNPLSKNIDFHKNMNMDTATVKTTEVTGNKETTKVGYGSGMNEFIDKSYPENQIEYLNDLENDLLNDYGNNVNVRQKRSSVHDYDPLPDNVLMGKEKISNLENKLNNVVIEKNSEESTDMVNLNSVSSPNENEVQITIINFDDTDKNTGLNKPDTNLNETTLLKINSSIKDNTKTLISLDKSDPINTQKETKPKKCQLSSNADDETSNLNNYALLKLKDDSEVKDKITSINLNQLPNELSANSKDKQGNLPKRVQISSHTYKYDVLYDIPDNKATALNGELGKVMFKMDNVSYIITKLLFEILNVVITVADMTTLAVSDMKRRSNFGKESKNSE